MAEFWRLSRNKVVSLSFMGLKSAKDYQCLTVRKNVVVSLHSLCIRLAVSVAMTIFKKQKDRSSA